MLESVEFAIIAELAEREGVAPSFITRVLRPTPYTASPIIVEAIMDGKQEPEVTLARLLKSFPIEWKMQVALFMQT